VAAVEAISNDKEIGHEDVMLLVCECKKQAVLLGRYVRKYVLTHSFALSQKAEGFIDNNKTYGKKMIRNARNK